MMLAIDCGNTRLKWALYADGRRQDGGAVDLVDIDAAFDAMGATADLPVNRIMVANVAGDAIGKQIHALARARFGVTPEFAAVQADACGIRCAYQDPASFGVDRWLAMIAARALSDSAFAVVAAGTAVTFDLVAADGRHLGGLIWPGDQLMRRSLDENTAGIGLVPAQVDVVNHKNLFGQSTEAAVAIGSRLALAAAVDRAQAAAAEVLGGMPELWLTGGDAGPLSGWLASAGVIRADLVLDGLALLAAASESTA